MFLQAVTDDSASGTADERLFLAGYLNTAERWEQFAVAWAEVLCASPTIAYFKMAEAQNKRDQFKGWTNEAVDRKLLELATVVQRFEPFSYEISVSRKAYKDLVSAHAIRGLATPYFACIFGVVSGVARQVAEWQQPTIPTCIDFIFDEQEGVATDVTLSFEVLRYALQAEARSLINGIPMFRNDKAFLPLQAADFLAWHVRREHELGGGMGSLRMANELRSSPHLTSEISDGLLQHWGTAFQKVPGVEGLKSKREWQRFKRELQSSNGFRPGSGK